MKDLVAADHLNVSDLLFFIRIVSKFPSGNEAIRVLSEKLIKQFLYRKTEGTRSLYMKIIAEGLLSSGDIDGVRTFFKTRLADSAFSQNTELNDLHSSLCCVSLACLSHKVFELCQMTKLVITAPPMCTKIAADPFCFVDCIRIISNVGCSLESKISASNVSSQEIRKIQMDSKNILLDIRQPLMTSCNNHMDINNSSLFFHSLYLAFLFGTGSADKVLFFSFFVSQNAFLFIPKLLLQAWKHLSNLNTFFLKSITIMPSFAKYRYYEFLSRCFLYYFLLPFPTSLRSMSPFGLKLTLHSLLMALKFGNPSLDNILIYLCCYDLEFISRKNCLEMALTLYEKQAGSSMRGSCSNRWSIFLGFMILKLIENPQVVVNENISSDIKRFLELSNCRSMVDVEREMTTAIKPCIMMLNVLNPDVDTPSPQCCHNDLLACNWWPNSILSPINLGDFMDDGLSHLEYIVKEFESHSNISVSNSFDLLKSISVDGIASGLSSNFRHSRLLGAFVFHHGFNSEIINILEDVDASDFRRNSDKDCLKDFPLSEESGLKSRVELKRAGHLCLWLLQNGTYLQPQIANNIVDSILTTSLGTSHDEPFFGEHVNWNYPDTTRQVRKIRRLSINQMWDLTIRVTLSALINGAFNVFTIRGIQLILEQGLIAADRTGLFLCLQFCEDFGLSIRKCLNWAEILYRSNVSCSVTHNRKVSIQGSPCIVGDLSSPLFATQSV